MATLPGATQEGANACGQLGGLEWLRQIVVGAGVEPVDPVGDLGASGEHQGGCMNSLATKLTDDLEPVPVGETDIHDEQVGLVFERARHSGFSIARRAHAVAFFAQHAL